VKISYFNSLLYLYCKAKKLQEAEKAFLEFTSQYEASVKLYTMMLQLYVENNMSGKVSLLLQEMDNKGIVGSHVTWLIIIKMFAKNGELQVVVGLTEDMCKYNIQIVPGVFNAIFDMYVKNRKIEELVEIAKKVIASDPKFSIPQPQIRSLVSAVGPNFDIVSLLELTSKTYWKQLLEIFFLTLIENQQIEKAKRVIEILKKANLPINPKFIYTQIFTLCVNSLDKTNAQYFFTEMEKIGDAMNCLTFTNLIKVYAHWGDFPECNALLDKMRARGISPSVFTYTILIQAYTRHRDLTNALKTYQAMKNDNIVPTDVTYHNLLHTYATHGMLHEAHALLEDMRQQNIPRTLALCNILLNLYDVVGDYEKLMEVWSVVKEEMVPDVKAYTVMIKTFAKLERMEEVWGLWEEMKVKKVKLDNQAYASMVKAILSVGEAKKAEMLLREMEEMNSAEMGYGSGDLIAEDGGKEK